MPELMAASNSLAYLFTWWQKEVSRRRKRWREDAKGLHENVGAGSIPTFSGDPTAMLPSPRTASMRTAQEGSDILSIMLFISTSISINSVTTWWFNSCTQRGRKTWVIIAFVRLARKNTKISPQTFHAISPRKRRRWRWFSGTRRCCLKTDINTPRWQATWDQHALTLPCRQGNAVRYTQAVNTGLLF